MKEILTDDKMRQILGANYNDVIYYNFDKAAWNADSYLGFKIENQAEYTKIANQCKALVESDAQFEPFELVAVVTMVIDDEQYTEFGAKVKKPKFSKFGKSTVGTLVQRDRKSGKILPVSENWMGSGEYVFRINVARNGNAGIAKHTVNSVAFRRAVLKMYGKQK